MDVMLGGRVLLAPRRESTVMLTALILGPWARMETPTCKTPSAMSVTATERVMTKKTIATSARRCISKQERSRSPTWFSLRKAAYRRSGTASCSGLSFPHHQLLTVWYINRLDRSSLLSTDVSYSVVKGKPFAVARSCRSTCR